MKIEKTLEDSLILDSDSPVESAIKAVAAVLQHYKIELAQEQLDTIVRSVLLSMRSPSPSHIAAAN